MKQLFVEQNRNKVFSIQKVCCACSRQRLRQQSAKKVAGKKWREKMAGKVEMETN
jgi:hypothetical protein